MASTLEDVISLFAFFKFEGKTRRCKRCNACNPPREVACASCGVCSKTEEEAEVLFGNSTDCLACSEKKQIDPAFAPAAVDRLLDSLWTKDRENIIFIRAAESLLRSVLLKEEGQLPLLCVERYPLDDKRCAVGLLRLNEEGGEYSVSALNIVALSQEPFNEAICAALEGGIDRIIVNKLSLAAVVEADDDLEQRRMEMKANWMAKMDEQLPKGVWMIPTLIDLNRLRNKPEKKVTDENKVGESQESILLERIRSKKVRPFVEEVALNPAAAETRTFRKRGLLYYLPDQGIGVALDAMKPISLILVRKQHGLQVHGKPFTSGALFDAIAPRVKDGTLKAYFA